MPRAPLRRPRSRCRRGLHGGREEAKERARPDFNGLGGTKGQQLSEASSDFAAIREAAMTSKAWPYEEARKLLKRWPDGKPPKDGKAEPMLFETGYGPSGLPHIGTFNEVLRTTMVRHA